MKAFRTFSLILVLLTVPGLVNAQAHRGQMDTDGILSPGEIPNPNIRYRNPNYQNNNNAPTQNGCANLGRDDIGRPHVEIDEVKQTGNVFGDKVKVRGAIEGVCLAEAGLFEDGRKVESIPINTIDQFSRYEFEVKTELDNEPEIRVYTTNGDRDTETIEISD